MSISILYPFHLTTLGSEYCTFYSTTFLITVVTGCFADCKLLQRRGSAALNVFILSAFELKKTTKNTDSNNQEKVYNQNNE